MDEAGLRRPLGVELVCGSPSRIKERHSSGLQEMAVKKHLLTPTVSKMQRKQCPRAMGR